jgi:hypothetical protein
MKNRNYFNAAAVRGRVIHAMRRPASLSRQAGMTSLGILIMVTFIGLFAFAGIRLTPVYLNYMKVAGVLSGVEDEFDGQNPSRGAIRTSIDRRFEIESVSEVASKQVSITQNGTGFEVVVAYDHTTPFISNIYFTVRFNKSVQIRR